MAASLDGVLIKKANRQETFTEDQIVDLQSCMDPDEGYLYFARKFAFIQHPVQGKLLFDPYEYQLRLMHSYHNYRFNINMMPRQTGKTTCAAIYLAWYAMFNPDQTILVAAHKYSGASEIMQRIRFAYETLPDFIRAGVTAYNKGSLEFDNGSRIVAQSTTENTGRGLSISLAYLDEFAFVRPSVAKEFWTSLSPTLATGGKCIITSTPNMDDDQFAQIWRDANKNADEFGNATNQGINGFAHYLATWEVHPDRDEDWASVERGKIGEERFRREHNCEFIAFDETLIDSIKLSNMEARDPYAKAGQVRWYAPVAKGKLYMIGLDPSLGTGGDNSAIQVYSMPGMKQIAEWMHNRTTVQGQIKILREIAQYIESETDGDCEIYYSMENNTLGEAALVVVEEHGEENFPGTFLSETRQHGNSKRYRRGFTTTHKSKISACAKLKHWVETEKLEIASKPLLRELKTFIARGNSYSAKDGEHDDLVMALNLIVRMSMEVSKYEESAFEYLNDDFEDGDGMEPMPFSLI